MSARTSFYKNTQYHIIIALLLGTSLLLVVQESMAFFKSTLNAEEFENRVSGKEKESTLSNIEISNFILPTDKIEGVIFKNIEWTSIDASNKTFENVKFENCELSNLNFRNVTLINVSFIGCKLKNVVMNEAILRGVSFIDSRLVSTDPNIDNNYLEMDVDKVVFKNSELNNIGFYKSKGEFIFDNSKLNDVSGQSLKEGSALYFSQVNGVDIDFSRSNLTTLEIKKSSIKNSKANGCTIGQLLFEDSQLDFPIGLGKSYDTVIARNSGSILIAGTPTKKVHISDCPKDTRVISFGGDKFESVEIENCSPSEIKFYKSLGKYVSIENANVSVLDFRLSTIEHLKLKNVNIRNKLYYSSTNIKKLEATNISFGDNVRIKNNDSNIEIKEDK